MKKLLIAAAMMVVSISAQAGHEVGNGGGVIVCKVPQQDLPKPDPNPKPTVELLDLYEARVLRNLKMGMGDPAEDFDLKVRRTLEKFSKIAPFRTRKYLELYENFFNEAVIIPDADLVFIPDAGNLLLPKNCELKQVAIQKVPDFPGDNRYFISKEYWDLMDNNSKAALVLHEIIYNEGIYLGHGDSRAVRYLNSYLTSTKLEALTQEQMAFMLFKANFEVADLIGTLVRINEYDSNGFIVLSSISPRFISPIEKPSFFKDMRLPTGTVSGIKLSQKFLISWFSGVLAKVEGAMAVNLPSVKIDTAAGSHSDVGFDLTFQDGRLSALTFETTVLYPSEFVVRSNNLEINLKTLQIQDDKYPRTIAALDFDANSNATSYLGRIQTKNLKTGYMSPALWNMQKFTEIITADGVVILGNLQKDSVLPTVQGPLHFMAQGEGQGYYYMYNFNFNGQANSGILRKGQTVRTAEGLVELSEDMQVIFLENGLALLRSLATNPPSPVVPIEPEPITPKP